MTRDDKETIAKGLMSYKRDLRTIIQNRHEPDLDEYNIVEIAHINELARRLELDPEYFQEEEGELLLPGEIESAKLETCEDRGYVCCETMDEGTHWGVYGYTSEG